jgi:GntR family transcriptional regulator, rspAB operon transcriptional repressor
MGNMADTDRSAFVSRELSLEPIEQVDLPALVYKALRGKIFAGELSPGAKLDLDLLERKLRVSRTPISIALARLAEEGLVTVAPRRGTFIRGLVAEDVAEVWDIRRGLELLAAEAGVANVTDDALAQTRLILKRLAEIHESTNEDYVEFVGLDRQFHITLLELARNRRLVDIYQGLHSDVINARLFYHGRSRPWTVTDAEHQAILHAYEQRDLTAAKAAISAACLNAKAVLLQRIEELGGSI